MSVSEPGLNIRLDWRSCFFGRQQFASQRPVFKVLELIGACCMLYWSLRAFPPSRVNQPRVAEWDLGDFLKLKVEERASYIKQKAPERTHDSSVLLSEVAHDDLHLNLCKFAEFSPTFS